MILIVSLSISEGRPFCNKRDPLFKVERSKNANFVRYDACLLQDGNLSGSNPVDVYWVLGRGEKEELNAIEKEYAYGIDSRKKLGENKFRIVINALKDREIIVEELNADYKAFVRIKGKRSILEKVYVKSEERSLGFPKVNYVDLFGRSLQTNQPVRERIVPS
jgi:intergrase/recombinase